MGILLKQSTAATVKLGPFVDATDGFTAETALTISQADIRLSKNGGAFAQTNNAAGATHDENGFYGVPLNTTDTGTLGHLRVAVSEGGARPLAQDFLVVPANTYDSLVSGTDVVDVSVTQWLGTAAATPSVAGVPEVDLTHVNGSAVSVGDEVDANLVSCDASSITRAAFAADTGLQTARSNTAQTGASSTITLDASASSTTDFYVGAWVYLTGGTGVGQARQVTAYNGTTKVATVSPNWATAPDNTSTFAIIPRGYAGVNWANIISPSSTNSLSGTTVKATDTSGNTLAAASAVASLATTIGTPSNLGGGATIAFNLSDIEAQTDDIGVAGAGLTAVAIGTGGITTASFAAGAINAAAIAADAIGASELAADAVAEIADGVWDEAASGHVTAGTFGQAMGIVRAGTAQAGGATTITLDASASAVDDYYNNGILFITGGTGVGQSRIISDYVGSTKVATVAAWATNPSSDSVFVILPFGAIPGASAPTAAEIRIEMDANSTQFAKLGTVSNLGSGATFAANLVDIENQTDDIGTAGAGLTAVPYNPAWDADIQSEVQDAIEANHLDHLLAADYDPASKPGVATALLNELVENDGGVSRYTANALEQGPGGATASAIADAVWDEAQSDHTTAGTFGQGGYIIRANTAQAGAGSTITLDASASAVDDFYNNAIVVLTAGTGAGQARFISDYVGSTKVATVGSAWATNPASGTTFMVLPFGSIPGASAPTAGEVADAVWDEAVSSHSTTGTFGAIFQSILRIVQSKLGRR